MRGGFGCWAACGADRPNGCRGYSNIDVAGQLWGTPLPETCRRLAGLLGIVYEDGPPPPGCARPRRPAAPAPQKAESAQRRNLAAVRATPGARLPAELYGDLLSLITLTRRGACYLRDERRLDARAASAYGYRSVDTARQWGEIARFLAVSYREEELVAAGFPPEGSAVTLPLLRCKRGLGQLVNDHACRLQPRGHGADGESPLAEIPREGSPRDRTPPVARRWVDG